MPTIGLWRRSIAETREKAIENADSGAFRSQFCGREIVHAVLIAIENRIRLSERIGQFMNQPTERGARGEPPG